MKMATNLKTLTCLALIMLACLSHKAHADTICMRECPSQCLKRNADAHEIECYFLCVMNCEHCPDNPNGCPPDEETKKKLAEAKMTGLNKLIQKEEQRAANPHQAKN